MIGIWGQVLDVAIVTLLGALAVALGNPLVKATFRYVQRTDRTIPTLLPDLPHTLRGGTWIGMFERLAVYAAVISGWKETLAVILVVKGLARYPELSAPGSDAAERFIIGTFVSVLFAIGCAALALWLIGVT